MTDRDPEHERKLGEYLLAKCAADVRRSHELQAEMSQRLTEALEDDKEKNE